MSFPLFWKVQRNNLEVVTFWLCSTPLLYNCLSEVTGNCVLLCIYTFELKMKISSSLHLLLFYLFVTEVTNAEDLNVTVSYSKRVLVLPVLRLPW